MQIGVVFPQTEIGSDAGALRAYVTAAAELGYRHVLAYDHVLGADPRVHTGWAGPYDLSDTFHEPMVLYGWLAAFSPLELVTGILIAPQRQTALVAKQATEVDVLSGGRLRLGLGIGWNQVEYEALGRPFTARGHLLDEQIALLRRFWTEESVTFFGEFHKVRGAGLAPLPVQRPIPIWLGGVAPPALRRVGRLADGWFPLVRPGGGLEPAMEVVAEAASSAGRDPASIGMEGRLEWASRDPEQVARHALKWQEAGATHLSVNTMHAGARNADDHIDAITRVAEFVFEATS
jgi:probable F420-dependent oxidoreductase